MIPRFSEVKPAVLSVFYNKFWNQFCKMERKYTVRVYTSKRLAEFLLVAKKERQLPGAGSRENIREKSKRQKVIGDARSSLSHRKMRDYNTNNGLKNFFYEYQEPEFSRNFFSIRLCFANAFTGRIFFTVFLQFHDNPQPLYLNFRLYSRHEL